MPPFNKLGIEVWGDDPRFNAVLDVLIQSMNSLTTNDPTEACLAIAHNLQQKAEFDMAEAICSRIKDSPSDEYGRPVEDRRAVECKSCGLKHTPIGTHCAQCGGPLSWA